MADHISSFAIWRALALSGIRMLQLKEWRLAESLLSRALYRAEITQDPLCKATTLILLADCAERRKNYVSSERFLLAACDAIQGGGGKDGLDLGTALSALGQLHDALARAEPRL